MFTLRSLFQLARGYLQKPVISASRSVDFEFRCLPIDIDVFFHMNNSRYLQNAELSRWRTLPASNLASRVATKEGMMFLAVENNIKYIRPIKSFESYVISTTVTVPEDTDKFLYYRHTFKETGMPKEGGEPRLFADIKCKAVVKQKNGKTLKPSELIADSDFYQAWVQKEGKDEDMMRL